MRSKNFVLYLQVADADTRIWLNPWKQYPDPFFGSKSQFRPFDAYDLLKFFYKLAKTSDLSLANSKLPSRPVIMKIPFVAEETLHKTSL